ncbi:hypothetical protein [Actinomyces naeslundii]
MPDMAPRTNHGTGVDHNTQGVVREICIFADAGSIGNIAGEQHAHGAANDVCRGSEAMT